jgi:hypothetical protein
MFQQTSIYSDLIGEVIPLGTRVYLGQRAKNTFYNFVMSRFREADMTQAKLAKRIGKSPAQMNRMLASPGNWTIETIAVLLAGISAEEILPQSRSFSGRPKRNGSHEQFRRSSEAKPIESQKTEALTDASVTVFSIEKKLEDA